MLLTVADTFGTSEAPVGVEYDTQSQTSSQLGSSTGDNYSQDGQNDGFLAEDEDMEYVGDIDFEDDTYFSVLALSTAIKNADEKNRYSVAMRYFNSYLGVVTMDPDSRFIQKVIPFDWFMQTLNALQISSKLSNGKSVPMIKKTTLQELTNIMSNVRSSLMPFCGYKWVSNKETGAVKKPLNRDVNLFELWRKSQIRFVVVCVSVVLTLTI
jgi:hypothetical protein